MEEKEFPMDYFTPIVTINETPPEPAAPKSPKIKKIKIKIEGNEEGEISAEIVKQKKRGRPKKNPEDKDKTEDNKDTNKKERKRTKRDEDDDDDPTWGGGVKKKKKKPKKPKEPKAPKTPRQSKKKQAQTGDEVVVKSEPIDVDDPLTNIEIKKEIKEEPLDGEGIPTITTVPFTVEDIKAILPQIEDKRTFKCPLCSKEKEDPTERTPKELKQHYKDQHPGKRLRQSRFSLEIHPCDVCGKEFKTNAAVKEHLETHNNYFYCEICNSSHKKILDHIIHLRVHSKEGVFQCLMCDLNTPDINKITDHVNNHEDLLKYWCQTCKKGFQILPWFQEHDNYHTGLKPFDCEFCGKCFLYSRYLHAHKVNMHKEDMNCPSLHECVICNKQYQHKNSLKLHMNSHTGNFSICDICGKMLSSKEKLKFHIRTHTGYKPYSCTYCEKSFTKKPILVEHVRIHTGERPYLCDYCTKAFSQRSSLVIHMRGHTGERPYVCQFCTKGFVAKAMLNIHLKSCKGLIALPGGTVQNTPDLKQEVTEEEIVITFVDEDDPDYSEYQELTLDNRNILIEANPNIILEPVEEPTIIANKTARSKREDIDKSVEAILVKERVKAASKKRTGPKSESELALCPVCGKLVRIRYITRHMLCHGIHKCEICSSQFKSEEELDKHREIHLDSDYPCENCDLSFKTAMDYTIHNHLHLKTYKCPLCNFTTKAKSSICGHIKRHEGQYNYHCAICGKGFIGRALLATHEEIHLDIKRYACDLCGKKFSVRRYLDVHRQLNHKKELYGIEELFRCYICGREFTFEKSLRRHQSVIHQIGEDRTVQCKICDKIIANNYNLKMHMRIHTGEKNYCCDKCGKAFSAYKYWKKHKLTHERKKSQVDMDETVEIRLDDVKMELHDDEFFELSD